MHPMSDITKDDSKDETAACEMITTTLSNSVKKYLAPNCAVLFSGGVDSSLITALAARHVPDITLITVGFSGAQLHGHHRGVYSHPESWMRMWSGYLL